MPSLAVCWCLFRLMRHCFLGRWIRLPVSERFHLVLKCHLFDYSSYIQFCVHWHGGQCLRQLVPNYAVVFWTYSLGLHNLYMHTSYITNGYFHGRYMKQHILSASSKQNSWKMYDFYHIHNHMHTRVQTGVNSQGGYTVYKYGVGALTNTPLILEPVHILIYMIIYCNPDTLIEWLILS